MLGQINPNKQATSHQVAIMSSEHLSEAAIRLQKERFVQSLKQALIANKYSQRALCEALGITIGTLTKYLRGAVDPSKVGVAIMRNLAKELGFTTNTLLNFYETGEYHSSLTIDDVASWIRSEAGQADLPTLLTAMSQSTQQDLPAVPLDSIEGVSAFAGFSDSEAAEWSKNMHEAVRELCSVLNASAREAWSLLEEKLIRFNLTKQEIDLCWELAIGGKVFTGEEFTQARSIFIGRTTYGCPLNDALSEFKELDGSKGMLHCRETCLASL